MPLSDVEPTLDSADPAAQFVAYLDYYRSAISRKLAGMSEDRLRTSLLPTGWTPVELLAHLVHMERRWFVWGFLGEQVDDPWGDSGGDPEGPWQVPDSGASALTTLAELEVRLESAAERTRGVLAQHGLTERGAVGGRFEAGRTPPTLLWICFHVLQEYARHAGHLDIVRELADGFSGE